MPRPHSKLRATAMAACACALAAGCSARPVYQAEALHAQGRFDRAVNTLSVSMADRNRDGQPDKIEGHNTLWAFLEYGKMLQDAGRFEESSRAFDSALRIFKQLDEQAIISARGAGNNLGALLTDERNRDYLGAYHDLTGALTAQVINMLMLGRTEEAAAYARRVIDTEDASGRIAERIDAQVRALERGQDAERDRARRAGVKRRQTTLISLDEAFQKRTIRARVADLERRADPVYANGTNPYGFFAGGVAMLAEGEVGEARDFADRLRATTGSELLDTLASDGGLGNVVVVFFESGLSPARLDGSVNLGEFYLVPLPTIRARDARRPGGLVLRTHGDVERSEQLTDMDAMIATDFNERLPEIWGRPILSQSIKATATAVTYAALFDEDSNWDELALALGALWAGSARPDLRSWRTLPGEQHVAVLPRTSSGALGLTLMSPTGQPVLSTEVQLAVRPGPAFVYVRSTATDNLAVYVDALNLPTGPVRTP